MSTILRQIGYVIFSEFWMNILCGLKRGDNCLVQALVAVFCLLILPSAEANGAKKKVEIWDQYGLSGFVEHSNGCLHNQSAYSLEDCAIEITIPPFKDVKGARFSFYEDFYFMDVHRAKGIKILVTFDDAGIPDSGGLITSYKVTLTNNGTSHRYQANVDGMLLPDAVRDNTLLLALSLALQPTFLDHFSNYFSRYSFLNSLPEFISLPSRDLPLQSLALKGEMKQTVLLDLGDYYSHGFRLDDQGNLSRVVLHDRRGYYERFTLKTVKTAATATTATALAYLLLPASLLPVGVKVVAVGIKPATSALVAATTTTGAATGSTVAASSLATVIVKTGMGKFLAGSSLAMDSAIAYSLYFRDPMEESEKILDILRANKPGEH